MRSDRKASPRAVRVRAVGVLLGLLCVLVGGAVPAGALGNHWPPDAVSGFSTPDAKGYWLMFADAAVANYGDAHFYGDLRNTPLNRPVVGGAVARNGTGYWLVGSDGGIFTFGSAHFYGSMGATHLNQPVFSMALTRSGRGYWLVARDGGIFTFGDARFHGSTGGMHLHQPIVGITRSESGKGYRLVARDGGIFSFGDAKYFGSLPSTGVRVTDVVGMARTPTGNGYWIARSDGHVYAFGQAGKYRFRAASKCDPVTAIFSDPLEQGYRLVTRAGATISYGGYGAHRTGPVITCRTRR